MIGGGLRLARQARGYSQQQLAGMAGISRQAVSALESGVSDPSLRVALALARALGMTVEELFGPESAAPTLLARTVLPGAAGPDLPAGTRVALAPIGESFAALPLTGPTTSRAGFLPAGGLVTGRLADQPVPDQAVPDQVAPGRAGTGQIAGQFAGQAEVQPIGPPRPTLIVAGCDPALPLLEAPLALLDPPIGFTWWPCTSSEALRLAAAGLVHAAGVHLRGRSGGYNTGPAGESLGAGTEVIGFSAWREGLVVRPDLADAVGGVADVVAAGLRLVNREPGAEARRVLDRELASLRVPGADVPGYQTTATGHLQVADAIAAGLADAGVASEPAALAYGLAFVPLAA
ncbi:MAG: substrate-binding domain-containing protein, partial [Streptosporangiaceae bacterium]